MATRDQFLEGFDLLRPHMIDGYGAVAAEHDVFYVGTVFASEEATPAEIRERLKAIGAWHWSREGECWAVFT